MRRLARTICFASRRRHDRHASPHRGSCARDARAPRGLRCGALYCVPRGNRGIRRGAALFPHSRRRTERRRAPDRAEGRHRHQGRAHDCGLEDPPRLRPGLRLDGCRALQGRGPLPPRQDEHGRVRDGLVDRELRIRSVAEPVGPDARPGRLRWRQRGCGERGSRALGPRLRYRRLDQAAVRALRQRRAAPDLRHRLPLRDRGVRFLARPGRTGYANGARQRASLSNHQRPRRMRFDDRRDSHG